MAKVKGWVKYWPIRGYATRAECQEWVKWAKGTDGVKFRITPITKNGKKVYYVNMFTNG